MNLSSDTCYEALIARDLRFDGLFFVGVATTGIYCRAICPARTPRRDSCAFFPSAAAAERAGFRPCLRCRPELAPGNARVDSVGRLAAAAASRIEDGALTDLKLRELAAELGVKERHLRRVVKSEFGVSPVELAQTHRLLLAKRLLAETDLPMADVAHASGFSSVRRFNALFNERYRLKPLDVRRRRGVSAPSGSLACALAYRPPLDWDSLVGFLIGRASAGVEALDGDRYVRAVSLAGCRGWVCVSHLPQQCALRVEIASDLAPALLPLFGRLKRLFDLSADPGRIAAHLGALALARPGLRVPGAFDGFDLALRAVLGQRVSVKAATTLAGRFVRAFGEPIDTPFAGVTRLPATPERVASAEVEEIVSLGIVRSRAEAILALAREVAAGRLRIEPGGDPERTMAQLRSLPGIGEWTAHYVAMRALAWPDAFPHTDLGLLRGLGETSARRLLERAEAWRPWRAYAAMHIWRSLEERG
jgi:AraC family transcriptional regulator of adaptative response / DNA-3-methyladenine glycosylase II